MMMLKKEIIIGRKIKQRNMSEGSAVVELLYFSGEKKRY